MKRRIQYLTVLFVLLCTAGITLPTNYREIPGSFLIPGDLVLKERAASSQTPEAGYGYLWVKNDTPSVLKFTDDAGTTITLGSGGGGSFASSDITGKTQVTPVSGDFIIGTDASDSNNLKKFDIADILGAGGGITDGDTLSTGLTFPLAGLHILDTNASHDLIVSPGSNITADRTLTITTGDANRTLTLSGDTTLTGTNSGDVTLSGTPDYITLSGQVITRGLVDLTTDVTGELPDVNVSNTLTASKVVGSGSTTDAVDLATAEVAGTLADGNVSDTLTASKLVGSGSTTDAVDLATAEVAGTLPAASVGTGLTDAQVSDTLTASKLIGSGSTTDAVDLATAEVTGDLPLANIAQQAETTILGRAVGAGTGDATALTFAQQRDIVEEETELSSTTNATAWTGGTIYFHDTLTENTTVSAMTGTPRNRQKACFSFKAATGSDYTLAWNSAFAAGSGSPFAGTIPAVTTTDGRKSVYLFEYSTTDSKWWLCAHREDN